MMNLITTADSASRASLTTRSHAHVTSMNDNSHDYSSFDMHLVSSYTNKQLIYYFIINIILIADQAEFNNWLVNLKTDFDENSARFSTSCQKIILTLIILDEQLKTMFNSAAKNTLILSCHW